MKRTISSTRPTGPKKRFRVERRGGASVTRNWQPLASAGFRVVGRDDIGAPESIHEKQMILPEIGNEAPRDHAWATAKFSCDIMAEHALFFSLLMPPELAKEQRLRAIAFNARFEKLGNRLSSKGPPPAGELRGFVRHLKEEFQPLIDYKKDNHRAQVSGALNSLVWPLFFDHTAREAERWVNTLENIAGGQVEPDRKEVVRFWAEIMDDHFRFIAHLLDPDEHDLVKKAYQNCAVFQAVRGGRHGADSLLGQPRTPPGEDPAMILRMAEEVVEFKTDTVRQIEAGKIRSIISPILGDHVRREAVWFVDELRRLEE